MSQKTAVVLFNLGGPDSLEAVEPFLFNLFNDPAIIRLPGLFRMLLARLISRKRGDKARGIYQQIGGKSPLLEETQSQADALEKKLSVHGEFKTFICMRYWHPMSDEVARQLIAYQPEKIIFLPLYPQYSTTTTASSFADLEKKIREQLRCPIFKVCCYYDDEHFAKTHAELLAKNVRGASRPLQTRILFSAHGLPEKIIAAGDPYQWQVEQTVAGIMRRLELPALEHTICYQSRVGPLKWIGPSTEDEIARAGADGKDIILVPVAFVSEHSETLVELDIEYRELAHKSGVGQYIRVPTLRIEPGFIDALAGQVLRAEEGTPRRCPATCTACPQPLAA